MNKGTHKRWNISLDATACLWCQWSAGEQLSKNADSLKTTGAPLAFVTSTASFFALAFLTIQNHRKLRGNYYSYLLCFYCRHLVCANVFLATLLPSYEGYVHYFVSAYYDNVVHDTREKRDRHLWYIYSVGLICFSSRQE